VPRYRYKAATPGGEVLQGEMEASSQDMVIRRLQLQGHIPIHADEVIPRARFHIDHRLVMRRRKVTRKDVAVITLELSTLLQSGLSLDKALGILVDLAEHDGVRAMLSRIQDQVRGGASLSAAMEAQGSLFSRFYLNMVRAGEAGGALDGALARLNEFMERIRSLRESLISALIYPAILVLISIVSVIVLLAFVVPRFSDMFQDAGQALPWSTQMVVTVGSLFEHYWWALALLVTGGYYYMRHQLRNPATRLRWDKRLLRLPFVGDLIAKLEAARFTRTLGTLLSNGVPLLGAIAIAKEIIHNQVIAQGIAHIEARITAGQGIAQPLMEAQVFPRLAGHLLQVGEETGTLEEMLWRLAEIYEREVHTSVQRLVSLVEPVLILGLGLLIGGIIMSVLTAILGVNELGL
jgi:general secretion pathway protein F